MSKFCRLIENQQGDQLLIRLEQSNESENKCNIIKHFEIDGAEVKITIGCVKWKHGEKWLSEYPESEGIEILSDPMGFMETLMG